MIMTAAFTFMSISTILTLFICKAAGRANELEALHELAHVSRNQN